MIALAPVPLKSVDPPRTKVKVGAAPAANGTLICLIPAEKLSAFPLMVPVAEATVNTVAYRLSGVVPLGTAPLGEFGTYLETGPVTVPVGSDVLVAVAAAG